MDVKLVVTGGSKAGQAIPVTVSKFFVGRAEDCHLKPRSDLISRYHCVIITEDAYVAIRDMQSKNGVYVNGEKVTIEQELKNGDKLVIGPLEFEVYLSVGVQGDKMPKVDSVKKAVERTIEVATKPAAKSDSENEVTDWLMGDDENNDQETQTVDLSRIQDEMEETKQPAASTTSDTSKHATDSQQKKTNPKDMNSQDAAANLLKNFFKGGR